MVEKCDNTTLIEFLKKLILSGTIATQEQICERAIREGFSVNQSKISRLLRKAGFIKVIGPDGKLKYSFTDDVPVKYKNSSLRDLVIKVSSNEVLIVIETRPGSASFVAGILDHTFKQDVLGTVAGDDTVFIAPRSTAIIDDLKDKIAVLVKN